ncbi:hypothetical protein LSAT2_015681 [Lamellibrachia satsuma]|nr:hypothetical protein LSAT2_015681 [Lamellibrachia satsuma]
MSLNVNIDENFLDINELRDILCQFTNGSANANRDCVNLTSLFEYYSYDTADFGHSETRAIAAMIAVIFLLGIAGHSVIVYVLVRSGTAMTVTNLYLMSLCASDLIFLAFCVPFTGTVNLILSWPFGVVMCEYFRST